jgi:hypothetical protein
MKLILSTKKDNAIDLQGFFYNHRSFETIEKFIEYFNNYVENSSGQRFHRLLTSKEIDFLCEQLKKNNY